MKKMKIPIWLLIVAAPVLNIALNLTLQKAARQGSDFLSATRTTEFLVAFALGLCSMLTILLLYSTGVSLARAILLMGAISILGGSAYGVLKLGNTLDWIEWGLLLLIAALLLYRAIKSSQ